MSIPNLYKSIDKSVRILYYRCMLVSKIPQEMDKRGLKPADLVEAGIVSQRSAYKIYSGDTSLRLHTLGQLCKWLGVRFLDDLVEFTPDEH